MRRLFRSLWALIWKDAKLFAVDRQAVVMSLIIPILIATILGWLDLSAAGDSPGEHTRVIFVDQDGSTVSKALEKSMAGNPKLSIQEANYAGAYQSVKDGRVRVAVVIPKGFGAKASLAMSTGPKADLTILNDPSEPLESRIVEQIVYEQASRVVARETFGDLADKGSPVTVIEESAASGRAKWAQSAHDYSGFGLQGLLFFAVESGVVLSKERRAGVWRRLKSSPVSTNLILLSRALSSTLLALVIILLMFLVGGLLFGIRVKGSFLGFFGLAITSALMAATFGLLVSTLGRTETQSRAFSILIIFVMLATGGAWFPLNKMPAVVQKVAEAFPVRWAVEGFDGTTWRGLPLADSLKSMLALLAFSAVFIDGKSRKVPTITRRLTPNY